MGFKHTLLNNFALIPDLSSPAVLKRKAITTFIMFGDIWFVCFYYFQWFKGLEGRTKIDILSKGNSELSKSLMKHMEGMDSFTFEMKANKNLCFCVQLFIYFHRHLWWSWVVAVGSCYEFLVISGIERMQWWEGIICSSALHRRLRDKWVMNS